MPFQTITVDVQWLVLYNRDSEAVRKRAADLAPALSAGVDPFISQQLEREFETEGAFFGAPWAELAPSTIERRKRPGHGRGGILRDTDTLYNAFVNPFDSGALRVVEPQFYARGVTDPVYPFLHEGTSRMPARPVVPPAMPPDMVDGIYGILREFILTGAVQVPS